jgi:hypothetical protein
MFNKCVLIKTIILRVIMPKLFKLCHNQDHSAEFHYGVINQCVLIKSIILSVILPIIIYVVLC